MVESRWVHYGHEGFLPGVVLDDLDSLQYLVDLHDPLVLQLHLPGLNLLSEVVPDKVGGDENE